MEPANGFEPLICALRVRSAGISRNPRSRQSLRTRKISRLLRLRGTTKTPGGECAPRVPQRKRNQCSRRRAPQYRKQVGLVQIRRAFPAWMKSQKRNSCPWKFAVDQGRSNYKRAYGPRQGDGSAQPCSLSLADDKEFRSVFDAATTVERLRGWGQGYRARQKTITPASVGPMSVGARHPAG